MPLDHLWATWRGNYVRGVAQSRGTASDSSKTLFEEILDAEGPDEEKHLVYRGEYSWALLNKFPYTSGHLLILPYSAVPDLEDLSEEEHRDLWSTVRSGVVALKAATGCDAVNVGLNLGQAAGGSQADHLHVHCVPRWTGDANFIGVTAETRVLPISLDEMWASLSAAWPTAKAD